MHVVFYKNKVLLDFSFTGYLFVYSIQFKEKIPVTVTV